MNPPAPHPTTASTQPEAQVLLIGERLNTLGSRAFRQVILAERYDEVLSIAEEQLRAGAQGLDICVSLAERDDEMETMRRVIQQVAPAVQVPLMIDTTRIEVMEAALDTAPGSFILNSTNLENGRDKADRIFDLARRRGAAVVALTIDEQGMARSAARKLAVAERLYRLAVEEHGLPPARLAIDALTFTLSIGDPEYANAAQETLAAVRMIKQTLPDVRTSLGISNVSFGFPPEVRRVLNNVMLHHAAKFGLDMAIINPAQVQPYEDLDPQVRALAEDLITNRPDAIRQVMAHYRRTRPRRE